MSTIERQQEGDPREMENFRMTAKASIEAHKRLGNDVIFINPEGGKAEGQKLINFGKSSEVGKPGHATTEEEMVSLDDPRAADLIVEELMRLEKQKQKD